ncbi:cytochrome P450 4C1-like [Maniola jurtina]|uniref:cytochrome P450 4C1-like n=1 Tax=Maniola jurtina TaxID=191418 RepID=UPI001E68D542|nr:cytochrome P450 4C1-like [Maniola jurtina]
MFLVTFFFGVLSIVVYALYERYSRPGRLMRRIPGPPAWPIIGNSLNYAVPSDKLFKVMRSMPKKYGHISQIHGLNTRIVNISNPEDIEKILSSSLECTNKKVPYIFLAAWLGDGLLISLGSKWQQRRKMLTKAFHFNILKKYAEIFKAGAERLVKRVEKETVKDKTDVMTLVYPMALRIVCETSMGLSMVEDSPLMKRYFQSASTFGECFALRMAKAWLQNNFIFNLTKLAKIQKSAVDDLHQLTTNVINDRRKMLEDNNIKQVDDNNDSVTYDNNENLAMLDLLLRNEKTGLINSEGIREEVDTFMFAGFDTTTLTHTYMTMAIANEPEIQDKLYKEQQRIFGDSQRLPTTEDLNEMKYLENCIKETLRIYAIAPLIMRHLVKDTVLSGYMVPAYTDCFISIYDLHHRADLYPDPERFDPDRFLPENSLNRNPYAYLPFSAGLRNCIGQKFAMLELKITMSTLLRKYRLEPVTKPSDIEYRVDILLHAKDPIYVRFRSRE